MKTMGRAAGTLAGVAALAALIAAAPRAGTVVIAVGGDVDSFNEYVSTSTLALDLADQLFVTLLEELPAPAGGLPPFAPRLARSWTVAPDGLSVSFDLRDDVRWSDGRPTTADDVRFTWEAQVDPRTAWPDVDLKANIADVKVESLHRVTFLLRRADPYALLEINEGHILPRHAFSDLPPDRWRQTDFSTRLVTNGPFRLESWKPGQAIALSRNPGYFEDGLPRLQRVIFRVVTDPAVRLRQLQAGETDVLEAPSPDLAERLAADPALRILRMDQRMFTYICWNNRREPFNDPRVRRALTLALDRGQMLAQLARGMGRASSGPIVSSQWAAHPGLSPAGFDPEAARRLLKEAGWEDRDADGVIEKDGRPFRFDLDYNLGNELRENLCLRASVQLAEVGVAATPRALEWAAFQKRRRDAAFDAFLAARISPTRVDLEMWTTGSPQNYAGYSNRQVDELAARAAEATMLAAARPPLEQAQEIIARDQPVTFLFELDRLYVARKRVTGILPGSLGILSGLRTWSVDETAGPSQPPAAPARR